MVDIKERIQQYADMVEEVNKEYYATHFDGVLTPPTIEIMFGKKYARIVANQTNGASRSVHSFIDLSNGDILKSASWQAPAKHARGSIWSDDIGRSGIDHFGAHYLR